MIPFSIFENFFYVVIIKIKNVAKKSPITEAKSPIFSALDAWPFWDNGYPSNAVGAEEGSPGVFNKIADTALPAHYSQLRHCIACRLFSAQTQCNTI